MLLLALTLPCLAQVVHVANYSGSEFEGWKRATVDVLPPAKAGQAGDVRFVLGRRIGSDARAIDLHLRLAPGEIRTIDLRKSEPCDFALAQLPANPLAFFGLPSIADVPFGIVGVQPDGAAWLAHLRARTGPMLCTDLWVTWYPDQPSWATAEAIVTASNPTVPDLVATVPDDFRLRFGTADVVVPGLPIELPTEGARAGGARLLPAGTVLGDGQARSFPLVFIWRQHLTSEREWSSAGAAASLSICANGIAKLWPDGNPQPIADPLGWTRTNWAGAIARLHTWDDGPLGVKKRSGDTGKQEDQVFVGGECCSGPASLGAETVRYLVALGQSRRPCHHLEASGALLDLARHPKLVIWSGRAHWHTEVSPDRLGKPRTLTEIESHGWSGPDREHWLCNNLAIAYRISSSPALQWQIEAQARLFLLQETVDPKLSTSDFSAERAIGWAGIVAVHLWRSLEDRTLAEQVAQRWRDRVVRVYIPKLGRKAQDVWYPRNDARLTADTGWSPLNFMPYQQAIGAYGLDYACRLLGPAEGRELALRGARAAMRAWERQPDGRWKPWSYWGYSTDSTVPFIERAGAAHGPNVWVWFTPGIWTVLAHEPQNEQARAIWQQVVRETDPKWIPVEAR
ncbi:MAG: hypothetical protein IT456_11420 [Planctomycetes bacterium]|nr:hypothetical protein [Planctomycetota bacterium]